MVDPEENDIGTHEADIQEVDHARLESGVSILNTRYGRGLARANKVHSRGECGEDVWIRTGGMVPLSWRFLIRLVLASARSGVL